MVSAMPALDLGYTTDPEQLIPGSLPALRADIDDLRLRAEDVATAVEDVSRRHVPGWTGMAATACDEHRVQQVDALTMVSDLYRIVATALAGHAETLVWARARAQIAVELWQQAQALQAVELRGPVTPSSRGGLGRPVPRIVGNGEGAALAQQAQAVLAAARHEVHLSGVAAAAIMDEMSDGLPDGRFHLDEFLGGIGDWIGGLAELVWTFNSLRWTIDPAGASADAEAMLRGLWDTGAYVIDNPSEAVPVLFDTQTLHDSPGRWWGNLFPDLALTAVGGVGIATRIGGIFRRGAHVADNLADVSRSGLPALAQSKVAMYQRLMDSMGTPEYLRRMFAGSQFDWMHQHRYIANQVWVNQLDNQGNLIGRFRLDSMNPGSEIVSRKLTDLSDVTQATARSYIDEVIAKYGPDNPSLRIGDTPANRAQLGHLDDIIGRPLRGNPVFEVPVQPNGVPAAILEYARESGVIIRDVAGTVYG